MIPMAVHHVNLSTRDVVLLVLVAVLALPLFAVAVVAASGAFASHVRRLIRGSAVAMVLAAGLILPTFYVVCYWYMFECWF